MRFSLSTAFATISLLAVPWARAQDVPSVRPGNFELGLFAGESYGLDRFRPMGGGNIAYGLSRMLYPFAEASYLPGILRTNNAGSPGSASYKQFSIDMTDFHAGVHIRVPRPESRVVPYGVLGLGLVHAAKGSGTLYAVSSFGTVDAVPSTVASNTSFAFNMGGGLRFFFTERFAVRLEFKAFKPTTAQKPLEPNWFYRFAIGPVFQLR